MFMNFIDYCERQNLNVFDYVPFTIIVKINGGNYKENFKNFSDIYNKIKDYVAENSNDIKTKNMNYNELFKSDIINYKTGNSEIYFPSTHYSGKNLWIIKPTDLWGGKCIQISDSILEIEKIIKKFFDGVEKNALEEESISEDDSDDDEKTHNRYRTSTVLLQKYIESPLLYNNRKFDIRMWALIDHKMDIYLFKEGHLKTTSTEYTTESKDKFVHITNYSLQKHNNNFEKFEVGNEVSFKDFQTMLDNHHADKNINIWKDIYPQMVEIIKMTYLSVKDKLNKKDRKYCYLLLGYDFMIDTNFKVWLIEINKNPGLVESSPVINALIPRLLDDTFKLTLDPVFESKYNFDSKYPVENYSDEENLFELILSNDSS